MDNTADLNAINAILMIAAAILLVLWLVWVVRLAACRHRMKTKNRMLLSRLEELQAEKRRAMSYEDIIDSYGNARAEEEAGYAQQAGRAKKKTARRAAILPQFTPDQVQQAVVMAEILGRPKAYRHHSPYRRR